MRSRVAPILSLCASLVLPRLGTAQVRAETIRGRAPPGSGLGILGPTVSATMAPDRSFQRTTTDSAGRFSIHFVVGTGDYLIHVGAGGFKTFGSRLARPSP